MHLYVCSWKGPWKVIDRSDRILKVLEFPCGLYGQLKGRPGRGKSFIKLL